MAGKGQLVSWTGAKSVVRIAAAATPSSDGRALPSSPPPVSSEHSHALTTPPSATATKWTRGKEPPTAERAGESDGWMRMPGAAITVTAAMMTMAMAVTGTMMLVTWGAGADAMAVTAAVAGALRDPRRLVDRAVTIATVMSIAGDGRPVTMAVVFAGVRLMTVRADGMDAPANEGTPRGVAGNDDEERRCKRAGTARVSAVIFVSVATISGV